jgi:hypothetical protein
MESDFVAVILLEKGPISAEPGLSSFLRETLDLSSSYFNEEK